MKNTLETKFHFSDYPIKISGKNTEQKIKFKQLLAVASVSLTAKILLIQKDYRVHPTVSDPMNWDENWFCNYE